MKFWILWGWDALIAAVFVYFFLAGLADGSVSSFNMGLWLVTLGVLAVVMLGSLDVESKAGWHEALAPDGARSGARKTSSQWRRRISHRLSRTDASRRTRTSGWWVNRTERRHRGRIARL
jgi:hypothetical protein